MNCKINKQNIKDKIKSYNLTNISGLNKKQLTDLLKNIENYINHKTNNYHFINMNNNIINLNDEQYLIITHKINSNNRIIACAGSGKTTTILARIKYLIDNNIQPINILLTTFNVDAAESMKKRLVSIFGFLPNIILGTFDSIACRYYYKYFKKDYYVGVSEYSSIFLEFLRSNEGYKIYDKIKYVFFDEFQDCSNIQFEIIKELHKKGSYVTVIGDDAQNIYQWRGSNIDYILNFDKYINDVYTHKLINNYRSTPEIVTISNLSIKNNTDQIPKEMIPNNLSNNLKPQIRKYSSEIEQANYIIDKVLYYLEKNIKLDDIAIISRNNYSLKIIEEHIEKFNKSSPVKIPYVALITEDKSDTKPKILSNHIILTSIHKSKGLEWDVVFLISCNDDKFPNEIDKISLQEERRLFYVAITRTKTYLHISFTGKFISRFISEIPLDNFVLLNFKNAHLNYQNNRNAKYKNDVTSLIEMIDPVNIEYMRTYDIIPEFNPIFSAIHSNHNYTDFINKYYLHSDFGTFIDRYITRTIGISYVNSNGLIDRTAKKIINSIKLNYNLYPIYNKYQSNFIKKIPQINNMDTNNIDKLNKTIYDPNYITSFENKDIFMVREIVDSIIKKSNQSKLNIKDIIVLPQNYLPEEFEDEMKKSYLKYKNKNLKNLDIIKDIYNISLCDNILQGRRRLLYKHVLEYFIKDTNLFKDIETYIDKLKGHELVCKKVIYNEKYDIAGEIDLIDITENKIIDYKCSLTECKLEWILQLLIYVALIKLSDLKIIINYIEIYNPLLGICITIDITTWDKETELLKYLNDIRDKKLTR